MNTKLTAAAAAVIAVTGTTAMAGNTLNVGTSDADIVIVDDGGAIVPVGSLGGAGLIAPAVIALAIIAAAASGGGS